MDNLGKAGLSSWHVEFETLQTISNRLFELCLTMIIKAKKQWIDKVKTAVKIYIYVLVIQM